MFLENSYRAPILLESTIPIVSDVPGLKDVLQGAFDSYKTCGNGACAIHSVFGVPDQNGEYKCEQARQLFHESLGGSYSDFRSKVDPALMHRWQRNLWLDMVRPCIDVDFKESLLHNNADDEVKMFCKTLAKDHAACQQIMLLHRLSENLRSVLNTAREDLARRFGACCRRGSAEGFVNLVLDKLGRLHEFRSQSKYDVLFESGPEALRYRKSVVASLGVQNFSAIV